MLNRALGLGACRGRGRATRHRELEAFDLGAHRLRALWLLLGRSHGLSRHEATCSRRSQCSDETHNASSSMPTAGKIDHAIRVVMFSTWHWRAPKSGERRDDKL